MVELDARQETHKQNAVVYDAMEHQTDMSDLGWGGRFCETS